MLTPSASRSLSPVVVAVLDALPDPPQTFTAADVLDALGTLRAAGVNGADGLDVADVLDAMLVAELASRTPATLPTRYVVHPHARPF